MIALQVQPPQVIIPTSKQATEQLRISAGSARPAAINPFNAEAIFVQSTEGCKIFENHTIPVLLVFSG